MSSQFSLSYRKGYYITHPHEFVGEIYRNLKWAFQRVFRGWDDRVTWSLDWYLAEMMPVWLRKLRDEASGYPGELTEQKWRSILNNMIDGFEAAYRILDDDLPTRRIINDKAIELGIEDAYFFSDEYEKIMSEAYASVGNYTEMIQKELNADMAEFKNGMKLLTEYFFHLWD